MEPKKISFGFSKIIKKPNLQSSNKKEDDSAKIELIKCVEEQSIQLLNQNDEENKPLVIPMKEGSRTSAALASLKRRHEVLNDEIAEPEPERPVEALPALKTTSSIEQKAVLELLMEASGQNREEAALSTLTVPIKPDDLPLEGASEPKLEDYENIPIAQFGLAMLRGMGWKDENQTKGKKSEEPVLRPKGMGLGADKVLKQKALLVAPEANEKLEIKKNAFVRVLGGKYKDLYGQIEGLDDHAGRVIIKLALGGARQSLNEFMVQPVSKKEYAQYGKVINSAKYEEYKKMENEFGQIIIKKEESVKVDDGNDKKHWKYSHETSSKEGRREKIKSEPSDNRKYNSRQPDEINEDSKRGDGRSSSRRDHRSRRRDADSSEDSDCERHRSSKKKSKSKKSKDKERRYSDSTDEDKRYKKKTKKSKRPRSRSRERR